MRGQRPALANLLAWVAMLTLLLGALPLLVPGTDPHAPSAMLQAPLAWDERGDGDVPLHEHAPAKLRRTSRIDDAAEADATPNTAAAAVVLSWTLLAHAPICSPDGSHGGCPASAQPPCADAPGRRQQRGQAPPLA